MSGLAPQIGFFGPLPSGQPENWSPDKLRLWLRGQTISVQKLITGALQVGQVASSSNFVAGTSGWMIDGDGNAEFNNVTVRGDIESGNWDGVSPANLALMDTTATVGFYLDSSVGAAQFMGDVFIGGDLKITDGTGTITISPAGWASNTKISMGDVTFVATPDGSGSLIIENLAADGFWITTAGVAAIATDNVPRLEVSDNSIIHSSADHLFQSAAGTKIFDVASGSVIDCHPDGAATIRLRVDSGGIRPFTGTAAGTANLLQTATGNLIVRATSSARWKTDIRPWDMRASVLNLTPSLFRSAHEYDDKRKVHLGLIAEDVAEVFPIAALKDAEGLPEGINWNAIVAGLISEVQYLTQAVARLEGREWR